ncbi:MAG: hypothetical protein IPJ41_06515 [Phycisphaerales bacterium]|nr:hypothetical protein [Phycisphaerales bacterium]
MGHEYQDKVSLEIARRIAAGLPDHPEWIELARTNLEHWSTLNRDAPRLLRNYQEWRELLALPVPALCELLTAPTDQSRRLRHNSPFVGILSPAEVWELKQRIRNESSAA